MGSLCVVLAGWELCIDQVGFTQRSTCFSFLNARIKGLHAPKLPSSSATLARQASKTIYLDHFVSHLRVDHRQPPLLLPCRSHLAESRVPDPALEWVLQQSASGNKDRPAGVGVFDCHIDPQY